MGNPEAMGLDTQTQSTVTHARADMCHPEGAARDEAVPSRLILVVTHGNEVQVILLPPSGEVVLGRGDGADVRISDLSLSRAHARFGCADGSVTVTDLGSRNGTFVRRQAVQQAVLAVGDFVLLGGVVVSVQLVANPRFASHEGVAPGVLPGALTANPEGALSARDPVPEVAARRGHLRSEIRAYEADLIRAALQRSNGNQRRAAELLNLPLRTFERRLAKLRPSSAARSE